MNNTPEREFEWEDVIENDGPEFILLPEGDYDFKVLSFERARHPGSTKLPPCNKAIVHIEIDSPEGRTVIKHNLFLHSKCEGMLCAFFSAIGQRKRGEQLRMNWNTVSGSTGRCKVGIRTWTKDDGSEGKSNEIKRFYEAEEKPKFTPGEF
jgi:hypothetical protein|nr:MAG TPA: Protein of unknown function (DUF669) [Caudoviricetes sp.]